MEPPFGPAPGPARACKASDKSSGSSGSAARSSPLSTSAVTLLSGSTLTMGPASLATVTSCFSATMLSWMGTWTLPPALRFTDLSTGAKPG